jgi:hypothetical protein
MRRNTGIATSNNTASCRVYTKRAKVSGAPTSRLEQFAGTPALAHSVNVKYKHVL